MTVRHLPPMTSRASSTGQLYMGSSPKGAYLPGVRCAAGVGVVINDQSTPSLYTWAGGADALLRLTEEFYRRVADDALLAPVFAGMDPGHAHYVALWLGEVFGGPAAYTAERGGYEFMLSKHLGRDITEQQRR